MLDLSLCCRQENQRKLFQKMEQEKAPGLKVLERSRVFAPRSSAVRESAVNVERRGSLTEFDRNSIVLNR